MKHKRVVITRYGGSEVLQVIEDEICEPKSGEVRVKVIATSAAFTDVLVREGLYPGVPPVPFSPGYDNSAISGKIILTCNTSRISDGKFAKFIANTTSLTIRR